jgi:hypothetical protein
MKPLIPFLFAAALLAGAAGQSQTTKTAQDAKTQKAPAKTKGASKADDAPAEGRKAKD